MPARYYAVRIGREGPRLYSDFYDFRNATLGLSGASGKGFDTLEEAEAWLKGAPTSGVFVTQTTTSTTATWDVRFEDHQPALTSTSTTVFHESVRRRYPEAQPGCRWIEYESPLNTLQTVPNSDRITPPPPYVPLQEAELPPPLPPPPDIELSEEQRRVLRLVESGKNIFFTGPAGTGKSVLLRAIIKLLRRKSGGVAITAPTGIAGMNIGGLTIHSWAGIGLGKETVEELVGVLSSKAVKRWTNTRALVIDEISMLDGRLFDKLEEIGRIVRNSHRPFGGIQLILSGDFFQLPPVPEQDSTTIIPSTFTFDALSWSRCVDEPVVLTKVFRQKDSKFVDMLSATRSGQLEDWHVQEFLKLSRVVEYSDGISPTQLFPLKSQVELCNKTHLDVLPGEIFTYTAMESRGFNMYGERISFDAAGRLLERLVAPREITLKVGAQVMLLRNLLQGRLVNGSLGKVVDFITTHEAIERLIGIADLDAKSLRSQDGDFLPTIDATVDAENTEVQYNGLLALNKHAFERHEKFPLVKFTDGEHLLCAPLPFDVQGLKGNCEAQRVQVPLVLSWAMSIHKAQGQTMSRVKVDLRRIFEKGQAYVALSRATSLEGLEIVGFDPSRVLAHPRVIEWQASWQAQRAREEEMDMDWVIEQYHSSTGISL